jgi:hypothetical protein
MNSRFKMSFNNSGIIPISNYTNLANNVSALPRKTTSNILLNSPMVERIHKVKPGCSACGKKVA